MSLPVTRAAPGDGPTPNLFIVGAPKSGTTALGDYLGSHPEVFVAGKELSYFGSDLEFRTNRGEPWRISHRAYLRWFEGHAAVRYRVDRSVFYLFSARAAEEIAHYDPDSRVIALVRNPVDQMHSQHGEMLYQGDEDIADFAAALRAEPDRRLGHRIPPGCQKAFGLRYRDLATYAPQLERYFKALGRERVCVVVHDDLLADPVGTYRAVLGFLGVAPDHTPAFDVVNAHKSVRSARARDLLRATPRGLGRVGRFVVRDEHARAALRRRLYALNTRRHTRPPVDAALRRRLCDELAPSVHRLEDLLGRDLSAWLEPVPVPPAAQVTSTFPRGEASVDPGRG